jgi:hypothetical protein
VTERITTPIVQVEHPAPTRPTRPIVTERIATPNSSAPGGQVVTKRMPSDAEPQPQSGWPTWLAAGRVSGRPPMPSDGEGLIDRPSSLADRRPTPETIGVAMPPAPPPGRMRRRLPIAMVIVGGLLVVMIGAAIPLDLARETTNDGGTSMEDGGASTEDGGSLAVSPALAGDPPAEPSSSATSSSVPPESKPAAPSRRTAPSPRRTAPQGAARLPVPPEPEIFQRPLRPPPRKPNTSLNE